MERVIPVEWVENWIEKHDAFMPIRYVKFMLQDWNFEAYGETIPNKWDNEFQEWLKAKKERGEL